VSPNGVVDIGIAEDGQFVATWLDSQVEKRAQLADREVTGVAISPNLCLFATSSGEGTVKLWDLATFQEQGLFQGTLLGVHSVVFSPDGRRLATGSGGRESIKLWDLETRQELLTFGGKGSFFADVAFSPDGTLLGASSPPNRLLHVWRAPSWGEIEAAETAQGKTP